VREKVIVIFEMILAKLILYDVLLDKLVHLARISCSILLYLFYKQMAGEDKQRRMEQLSIERSSAKNDSNMGAGLYCWKSSRCCWMGRLNQGATTGAGFRNRCAPVTPV
jgi:hypothetical protein